MYTKILIAEDHDSDKNSMVTSLKDLGIPTVDQVQFCDDALLRIRKGIHEQQPYELLITDLSFTPAFGKNKIVTGQELIRSIRLLQPSIKVIVFSSNDKHFVIKSLSEMFQIDGYVCKGLQGLKELGAAVTTVFEGNSYYCPVAKGALEQRNVLEIGDYELIVLRLLADGKKQKDIAVYLKEKKILPDSVRSVEDRISRLKDHFNATTLPQLIYIANKLGMIQE
ncbi:response regulator [uncultured Dokdonia sp.]|uniref:DNA-binding response regulator n=1 Tax=uncultured Dokdonia sp. TaxID=575653 RepID=UPI00260C903E|nr:response regulator [uncultured Dokdonia sp.]